MSEPRHGSTMGDWAQLKSNLSKLLEMHKKSALTEREKEIATMQFQYQHSPWPQDDFPHHPVIELLELDKI